MGTEMQEPAECQTIRGRWIDLKDANRQALGKADHCRCIRHADGPRRGEKLLLVVPVLLLGRRVIRIVKIVPSLVYLTGGHTTYACMHSVLRLRAPEHAPGRGKFLLEGREL